MLMSFEKVRQSKSNTSQLYFIKNMMVIYVVPMIRRSDDIMMPIYIDLDVSLLEDLKVINMYDFT